MFLKIILATLLFVSNVYAAPSYWVYDTEHKQVVYADSSINVRSIASITKLMTAMVVLDGQQSLTEQLKLTSKLSTLPKQLYTREDLIIAMLVKSDNGAAETLADRYPGGRSMFVRAMNIKAQRLGLVNTKFQDANGLGVGNISTAEEVGKMIQSSTEYEFIKSNGNRIQANLHYENGKRTSLIGINNTNQILLKEHQDILVSKTGYTSMAGWCIAFVTHRHIVVVLGEPSKSKRMQQVKKLLRSLNYK